MNQPYKTAFLLVGDVIVLYASLLAMLLVRYGSIYEAPLLAGHIVPFTILFILWLVIFYIHNLYDLTAAKNNIEFYTALGRAFIINLIVAVALFYFIPFFGITPKRNLFITLAFSIVLFSLWRQAINQTLRRYFRQSTMVIGPLKDVERIVGTIEKNPQIGYKVDLIFTERKPLESTPFVVHAPEEFDQISKLARQYNIRTATIAEEAYRNASVVSELEKLLDDDIEIVTLESMEERLQRKVRLDRVDEVWFFDHFASDRRLTYGTIKRFVDIIVAIIFLPIAALLGLIAALAIRFEGRGPIFYTQTRVGEHGKAFTMYKFRTMRADAEKSGAQWTVENDTRVTKVGRFLRKARLDELPQLINVLKGEMSFVGPRAERPEFHEFLKKEIPFYERRYLLKPGLTGWAQINYTYGSSVEDTRLKLAYDFYYLKNRSLIFDLGVILKTVDLVLRGLGR